MANTLAISNAGLASVLSSMEAPPPCPRSGETTPCVNSPLSSYTGLYPPRGYISRPALCRTINTQLDGPCDHTFLSDAVGVVWRDVFWGGCFFFGSKAAWPELYFFCEGLVRLGPYHMGLGQDHGNLGTICYRMHAKAEDRVILGVDMLF